MQVCDKIGVPRPSSDARSGMLATMHIDQLISLSDGHIVLDRELFETGQSPPLDPANSLTRIGVGTAGQKSISSSVHSKAIRRVTSRLRLELASLADIQFNTNTKEEVAAIVHRAFAWQAALSQPHAAPMSLGNQVLLLVVVEAGVLDTIVERELRDAEKTQDKASDSGSRPSVLPDKAVRAHVIAKVRKLLDVVGDNLKNQEFGSCILQTINDTGDVSEEELITLKDLAKVAIQEATSSEIFK